MSEDVSATMRVGITVILVAALVATVLNLMVMSNSLLSGGQTTLQSGIDSVSQQEFASYNNTKVSGTQVNTALNLFQGRDVAILIQTKTFKENYCKNSSSGKGLFMNYGALMSTSATQSQQPIGFKAEVTKDAGTGKSVTKTSRIGGTGAIKSSTDATSAGITVGTNSATEVFAGNTIAGSTAGNYYVVDVTSAGGSAYCYQQEGAPNLTGLLYDENGIVQSNSNVIGCSTLGNPQYLLSSARFQSILIKDATGSIIGVCFYQI